MWKENYNQIPKAKAKRNPKKNVKETTTYKERQITAKITIIERGVKNSPSKEELTKMTVDSIKEILGADDVVVTEVKDFEHEK